MDATEISSKTVHTRLKYHNPTNRITGLPVLYRPGETMVIGSIYLSLPSADLVPCSTKPSFYITGVSTRSVSGSSTSVVP